MPRKIFLYSLRLISVSMVLLHSADSAPAQTNQTRPHVPAPSIKNKREEGIWLTAQQLLADFAVFQKAYTQLHPGLYRYDTPEHMHKHFHALKMQLSRDQSVSEAYLAFALFLAKIKCGHSYPNFYNQPPSIVKEVLTAHPRIPFYFRWIGQKMIVTRSLSQRTQLVPGTEILSLNGVPVARIQDRILLVSRADGSNDAKRVSNIELRGDSKYEAFDIYFPLLFPFKGSTIKTVVRTPQSVSSAPQTLPMMTFDERLEVQKRDGDALAASTHATATAGDAPAWEFRFLPDGRSALLRMPTWALFNSKWDWQGFLDNVFTQLSEKKTENLILDLRGNEGGLSIGNQILSRLIKKDLLLESFQRWVRYRKVPEDLVPYLDTWDPSFRDWSKDTREATEADSSGFFRMTRFDDASSGDVIKASDHPFSGKTYVIVDASNSSATFEFAQILKQNHLATLVGQPTGGNQRGINGGAFFFLNLPNSKIEIDLPLVGFFPPSVSPAVGSLTKIRYPDVGLTPDIQVMPNVKDIQSGLDTELKAVQGMIEKRRTPHQ